MVYIICIMERKLKISHFHNSNVHIQINGCFFRKSLYIVISHFIHLLLSMWFILLVSTLHVLLVARSGKLRQALRSSRTTFWYRSMHEIWIHYERPIIIVYTQRRCPLRQKIKFRYATCFCCCCCLPDFVRNIGSVIHFQNKLITLIFKTNIHTIHVFSNDIGI